MKVTPCPLAGVLVIEPKSFSDDRGFFLESYHEDRYRAEGITDTFVQQNHSRSMRNVLRGLHATRHKPQAQIVTVFRGKIFDVVVDLRPGSTTYARWFGVELSEEGPRQIYMPAGFAHGFCVLSDVADLHYNVSQHYDPGDEVGIIWNDPEIGIEWPLANLVISSRDRAFPSLTDMKTR